MYSVTVGNRRLGILEITFFSMAPMLGVGVACGVIFCGAGVKVVLIEYFSGSSEGRSFLHTSKTLGVETPIAMALQ